MRVLHTGDWHLGRYIGPFSRLPEQYEFIDELIAIARETNPDMVLVAGDVYDTHSPPAEAEQLFYNALGRLTGLGVCVLVIAGNHDNPVRLSSSAPIALPQGAILVGAQDTVVPIGAYGGFEITASGMGWFEMRLGNGQRTVAAMVPFPSEKRLNQLLGYAPQCYSEGVHQLIQRLAAQFREDTVNLLAGHFFVAGGALSSDSERPIQVGGAYAIDPSGLPANAYIAMGHLHRPQQIKQAVYAGSPIQYSLSETGYAKCVMLVDLKPGGEVGLEKIYLRNYKPIEHWKANSIEEALALTESRASGNCWAFLEIHTHRPLAVSEVKRLRELKRDLVEICPIVTAAETEHTYEREKERTVQEMFAAFYQEKRNAPPSDTVMEKFNEISTQ